MVRVYDAATHAVVCELPGPVVEQIIEHYVAGVEAQRAVYQAVTGPPRQPLARVPHGGASPPARRLLKRRAT